VYIVGEFLLNQNIISVLIFICYRCNLVIVTKLIAVVQVVSHFGVVFRYMRSELNTLQMKVSGFNVS
jgi:hypothetical protein